MTDREAQKRQILRYLQEGNSLTGLAALTLCGCMRLPARVADLRADGWPVLDDWEYQLDGDGKVRKKWKKYFMAREGTGNG